MSYFEESVSKFFHGGNSVGVVKQGDNQTVVNEKLAAEIEKLKESKSTTTPEITSDNLSVTSGFGSDDKYSEYTEKYQISVTPKNNYISVDYDLSNLLKGVTKKSLSVTVDGKRGGLDSTLVSSDKTLAGFSLSPDNFPATLTVDLKVNDGKGDKQITSKLTLNPAGESGMYAANVKEFRKSDLRTQTQVNEYLNSRIANVEKNFVDNVVLGSGTYTTQEALSMIWKEIQDLKNLDLSSIEVTYKNPASPNSGNVTKSIGQALNDIIDSI